MVDIYFNEHKDNLRVFISKSYVFDINIPSKYPLLPLQIVSKEYIEDITDKEKCVNLSFLLGPGWNTSASLRLICVSLFKILSEKNELSDIRRPRPAVFDVKHNNIKSKLIKLTEAKQLSHRCLACSDSVLSNHGMTQFIEDKFENLSKNLCSKFTQFTSDILNNNNTIFSQFKNYVYDALVGAKVSLEIDDFNQVNKELIKYSSEGDNFERFLLHLFKEEGYDCDDYNGLCPRVLTMCKELGLDKPNKINEGKHNNNKGFDMIMYGEDKSYILCQIKFTKMKSGFKPHLDSFIECIETARQNYNKDKITPLLVVNVTKDQLHSSIVNKCIEYDVELWTADNLTKMVENHKRSCSDYMDVLIKKIHQ